MGTDQIYKKLSTSLATGNGIADIIAIEGDVLVGYADKFPEGFLDVSDAINTDDFLASKIGEVSYKDKIHAFPWDAGPAAMFYRTDYFEQAGVNPEDIQTWDDLIEAGKKIEASCKTPSGDPVKMIPVDPKKSSLYSMIRGEFGIGVFDEDGKPIVDDERSIEAMEEAKKIYDSGVVLNYNGWDEYEQTVVNESVAAIPEAVWMIGTIKDKGPDTAGKCGLYPSYIPSYEEEIFQKGDSFFGDTNIYEIFIENGKNVAEIPVSPNAQEAGDSIGAAVSKIFLNGADVKSTMKDLEDELTTKFK